MWGIGGAGLHEQRRQGMAAFGVRSFLLLRQVADSKARHFSIVVFSVSASMTDCKHYPYTRTSTSRLVPQSAGSTHTYTPHSNSGYWYQSVLSPGQRSGTSFRISGLSRISQPESIQSLPQVRCRQCGIYKSSSRFVLCCALHERRHKRCYGIAIFPPIPTRCWI